MLLWLCKNPAEDHRRPSETTPTRCHYAAPQKYRHSMDCSVHRPFRIWAAKYTPSPAFFSEKWVEENILKCKCRAASRGTDRCFLAGKHLEDDKQPEKGKKFTECFRKTAKERNDMQICIMYVHWKKHVSVMGAKNHIILQKWKNYCISGTTVIHSNPDREAPRTKSVSH